MSKIVLITGCRSGFGLLTALACAQAGHTVYAGLRDLSTADELRRAAADLPLFPLQLDVTDATQRQAAMARIQQEQGRLDVLVNNAGVAMGGFVEQVEDDELRRVFEVNVFGTWGMTRAALPMLRASRGVVVQVSSLSGRMAFPGLGLYASSKFALEGMSEALRNELHPMGVRVVLVEPGAYRTDIFGRNRLLCRGMLDPASPYARYAAAMDKNFAAIIARTARDPQEVAQAILAQVEGRGPKHLRLPIGPGSTIRSLALRLLPDEIIARLVRLALWREVRD